MMPIEWKRQDPAPRYGSAAMQAMLGDFVVGTAVWNQLQRGQPPYEALLSLPGFKERLGRFETEAEAMQRVEAAVLSWVRRAGLVAKERTANEP